MPGMPRSNKKATQIAYSILGEPANIAYKPTRRRKSINRRLDFEYTTKVR